MCDIKSLKKKKKSEVWNEGISTTKVVVKRVNISLDLNKPQIVEV